MVAHRKTPSKRAYVLPGWFFLLATVVVIAAVAGLAWVALDDPADDDAAASPSPSASASASPTPTRTTASPSPSPSATTPSASPTPSATPSASRSAVGVSVLNGTRTPGLARVASTRVQQVGWTVGTVGNWRAGGVGQTTVFYPVGREAEARLLADDLGVETVAAAVQGMSTERLTLVVLRSLS